MVAELGEAEALALVEGRHTDPFSRLGLHEAGDGSLRLRVLMPGAERVGFLRLGPDGQDASQVQWLSQRHRAGLFEARLALRQRVTYRLRIGWPDGQLEDREDPYRFGLLLGDLDLWLWSQGRHLRPFEVLGAHRRCIDGVHGVAFAVWAPNASRVSVVGEFNAWDGRMHPMRLRREAGIWELFIPGVPLGVRYKYELVDRDGGLLPLRADPFAFASELRPATASLVAALPDPQPSGNRDRQRANAIDAPIAIYEVHLGSWARQVEQGRRFLNWQELGDRLIPYAIEMGFTHLELMPITEHPFDGSWGYQPLGLYAASSRFGSGQGLVEFVTRAHAAGLGVLLDWVPAHFPGDAHGLAQFDGTALYEHAEPHRGLHPDWKTLIYNLGRHEVANFLSANALYWIERYGVDGLRVDAVASMLYLDYSRGPGQWQPNEQGGRENLESVAFLRGVNEMLGAQRPEAITLAEESTAWPGVSRPVHAAGLGFHYKWNMGWMNDTLRYMRRDPVHRQHHQQDMTFGLIYAFDEHFVLPLSHDEVVHGKGSLLAKMPGDPWQQFANLRAYYGFMYGHPGKKLLFMGAEFAQVREWDHDQSLDWHLLDDPMHRGVQSLVRDLNRLYRSQPALHRRDCSPEGFAWIDHSDHAQSVLAFVRQDGAAAHGADHVIVVCNFTPVPRHGYRMGVPQAGWYREVINTDSNFYGGSNLGNAAGGVMTEPVSAHGWPQSVSLVLPPLATLILQGTR
jgi:1,4-alpha-glucan branching enzyme